MINGKFPVIKNTAYCLFHTPSLVRFGSKPSREIPKQPGLLENINKSLRSYEEAVAYPPHQVFIGNLNPDTLNDIGQPWFKHPVKNPLRNGPFGEIMPEDEFIALLRIFDEFDLVWLKADFIQEMKEKLKSHPLITEKDLLRLERSSVQVERIEQKINEGTALPLYINLNTLVGCIVDGHDEDDALRAPIILENLACKASGIWAMRQLLHGVLPAEEVDYVMNCGEEASGDRYQRGGGSLAKAMAEHVGCTGATGSDLKAYCCAPIHTSVLAASLVQSGVMKNVIVVGGGSLAKLGMKHRGHLKKNMPIMEDVLGALAVLIGPDDAVNPYIKLDVMGKHNIAAGDAPPLMMQALIVNPLEKAGMKITDIDKFSLELHNPEITSPAGSGDPALNNYKTIASIAAYRGEIKKEEINSFIRKHGMPGFSPTQGHIAAGIPYLGHARKAILEGKMDRAMFVAKGSLFLGKMTTLSDGMSFLLEGRKNSSPQS
jgi:hypothetical protein